MSVKELRADLKAKKNLLIDLEDAETELDLADEEEPVSLKFGSCFIRANVDESLEYVTNY